MSALSHLRALRHAWHLGQCRKALCCRTCAALFANCNTLCESLTIPGRDRVRLRVFVQMHALRSASCPAWSERDCGNSVLRRDTTCRRPPCSSGGPKRCSDQSLGAFSGQHRVARIDQPLQDLGPVARRGYPVFPGALSPPCLPFVANYVHSTMESDQKAR